MHTQLAHTIRAARLATRLTQEQLGRRIGLKGRAVYRWERGDNEPTRRHRHALVAAIAALDRDAGAHLEVALQRPPAEQGSAPAVLPIPTPPERPAADGSTLELLLFGMADELDLPPRRASRERCQLGLRSSRISCAVSPRDAA